MDIIKSAEIINKFNNHFSGEILSRCKILVCFFCASWCKKTNNIVSKLTEIFELSRSGGYSLEILYVPLDKDEESMMEYFQSQGTWYSLKFGDPLIELLRIIYNVTTMPTIIVLKQDGSLISRRGYEEVSQYGVNVLVIWNY